MQELRFVGLEDDWLIATDDRGERFRLRADDVLRDALRPKPAARPEGPRVPPRQIQQLIRAGRSVEEVVEQTGADLATVQRFEGPILAERAYIVDQARAVAVRLMSPIDPMSAEGATFGVAIDSRLEQLGATGIGWDAWKDPETGWHIGLEFTADDVARSALWEFNARARTLHPVSPAAITLSQQSEPSSLAGPHLRAVGADAEHRGAEEPEPEEQPTAPADQHSPAQHETEDLLEALRRRRGERQHSPYAEEAELDVEGEAEYELGGRGSSTVTPFARGGDAQHPSAAPAEGAEEEEAPEAEPSEPDSLIDHSRSEPAGGRGRSSRKRGGRPSMPSWDEIVFGTRSDED
ncbi:septation protein SepH [Gulosibacter sp. 10]|uniref:septation protein SepH n=1 Tax=Gulosibacter sp. 10 TaxID=1255570 RepID=UPI00097F4A77|nr:septation protein SepH [Gulosibacter sp. 10]SJM65779.1 putative DNA-binding protein [Gulosibacter sp. 10]